MLFDSWIMNVMHERSYLLFCMMLQSPPSPFTFWLIESYKIWCGPLSSFARVRGKKNVIACDRISNMDYAFIYIILFIAKFFYCIQSLMILVDPNAWNSSMLYHDPRYPMVAAKQYKTVKSGEVCNMIIIT